MENEKLQKKALDEKELDLVVGGSWSTLWKWMKDHFSYDAAVARALGKDENKSLFL